jgi:shikimate kinase
MSRFIRNKVIVANPDASMVRAQAGAVKRDRFNPREANIFLVGLRGSGKTSLGRLLAERTGAVFVDTDEMVAGLAGQDIAGIVADRGWEAFRALETEVLRDVCSRKGQVIATGGGIVLDPLNRSLMEHSGTVIFLMAELSTLGQRLAGNPQDPQRPPLSALPLAEELLRCKRERDPIYMCLADHILRVERDLAVLVEEVLEKVGYG